MLPVETLGGFDPPIQHHPYGHSTANRVPAVGRNKIDPVNLDLLLPAATDAAFGPIRMLANLVRHYSRGTRLFNALGAGETVGMREGENKGKALGLSLTLHMEKFDCRCDVTGGRKG